MTEPIYVCPACGSDRVTTGHIQTFMVYIGGHATCLACWWKGERKDLKEVNHD